MTVDPLVYELAQFRCTANGFNNSVDIQRMAEAIQSAIEEVEADLMKEYEEETHESI